MWILGWDFILNPAATWQDLQWHHRGNPIKLSKTWHFHMSLLFLQLVLFVEDNLKVMTVSRCLCLSLSHLSPARYAPSAHGSCSTWPHPSCRCGHHGCWGRGRSLQQRKKRHSIRAGIRRESTAKMVKYAKHEVHRCGNSVGLKGDVQDRMISGLLHQTADWVHENRGKTREIQYVSACRQLTDTWYL